MGKTRRPRLQPASGQGARLVPAPVPTPSVPATRGWFRASWRWVLIVGLVLAVYAEVLNAEFVNWDDPVHVTANARVTAPDALERSWRDGANPGFYPVLYGIYRVEWLAANGKPWLFHLDNVALHAANALLVGSFAGEIGLAAPAPWLVAGLWALHPVHVESVAWITERKNVLYTFFWLASLLLYLRAGRAPAGRRWLDRTASLVLFACALLSKAAAITLPAALVLVEWGRGGRLDRRFWLLLAPYLVLGMLGGFELMQLVPDYVEVPPLGARLIVSCRSFWIYLASFLWPHRLLPLYPTWSLEHADLRDLLAVLGLVVLAAVAVAMRARLPRTILIGAALFASNILLVVGVVWNSYMDYSFVADRYLYLPAVGLAVVTVAGVDALRRAAGVSARIPTAALALASGVLGVATWRQVPVWHDSESLWTYTLEHHPDCLPCHQNLALVLLARGDLDAAAAHYEAAMRIGPDVNGLLGFGTVRLAQKRTADAAELFESARQMEPENPRPYYHLGVVLEQQGRVDEAIARYREALRLDPTRVDVRKRLAAVLLHVRPQEEGEATLRGDPPAPSR